ncbi:monosaccharide ABC transporter substrate-binding protein, CUT2 family [Micromonospora pattaloongensis]|uniref:Monosaccharide ABC transporter substrate-binding protein, CUT2 family n=1 Tax=Micromonospora pattaloongensis TaxID=405436 RepID=A0A1H3PGE3_9ACTN|nr:substrate-binding domain-containing protein [Micromonospora pattaloongensis]SDZ00013.1 monosaccharide ABC transporter substrate-binding protein, CUT2 family [Micromonospora pattaloongensis]
MKISRRRVAAVAGLSALVLLAGACGSGKSDSNGGGSGSNAARTEPSRSFTGPNGETPTAADQLKLTPEDEAKVKAGNYTAAFVWHESSALTKAVESGVRAEFDKLGIKVVASTSAEFDAAKQANNVQTVLALKPDAIVTIAVDPTAAAAAFKPAVDQGVKVVVMTTPPKGFTAGKEIVGIVTVDLTAFGKANAELIGKALGGKGKVGYLYHDADFWFTNQRDKAFKDWLGYLYPDIEIVEEAGFSDPARTEDIANAMITRNPELKGVYVAWATAAEGVLAAARQNGRNDLKIVTNDLEANLAADMVSDGNVVGIVANGSTRVGQNLGIVAAYGLLGKKAPALTVTEPMAATKDNIAEAWRDDFGTDAPAEVLKK